MSVIGHLRMVPPAAWPLGVGLMVNSAIFYGNLGNSLTGAVPIAQEQLGKSGLRPKDKVRIWALFYETAATYIVPGVIGTTALHLLAAYLTPSRRVRNFCFISAAASASMIPYTLLAIMPTNRLLLGMNSKAELTPAEEKDVGYYIAQWNKLHKWRYIPYAISWTWGLGGLIGVAGKW